MAVRQAATVTPIGPRHPGQMLFYRADHCAFAMRPGLAERRPNRYRQAVALPVTAPRRAPSGAQSLATSGPGDSRRGVLLCVSGAWSSSCVARCNLASCRPDGNQRLLLPMIADREE